MDNEMLMKDEYDNELLDISKDVKLMPEVQKIADSLDIKDAKEIMNFGQETAVEISKFSDSILSTINNSQIEDSGRMMKELNIIMDKFDPKDFDDTSKNLFSKIFGKVNDEIQKLLRKYETMDKEMSKVFIEIKKYESEIGKTNDMLNTMYEKNIGYYKELEKYIYAGNIVIDKLKNQIIPQYEQKFAQSGNELDRFNLQNASESLEMMEQRVYDLELAKMVSIQTAPQIKLIQRSNYNLLRKIGSAFVVTIPVFKTGLIQAITIKRQKVQADAMKALDDRTNEMLIRNAQNISSQSSYIAKLSGSASIQIETLEKTFNTIVQGIEDTRRIEQENKMLREQGKQKLQQLQMDIQNKFSGK